MTRNKTLRQKYFPRGINDTPFPDTRAPDEAKNQTNWKIRQDGSIQKSSGRETQHNMAATPCGIIIPPKKFPICELVSSNNSLYIDSGGTKYTAVVAEGIYYSNSGLATALQNALNGAVLTAESKDQDDSPADDGMYAGVAGVHGSSYVFCVDNLNLRLICYDISTPTSISLVTQSATSNDYLDISSEASNITEAWANGASLNGDYLFVASNGGMLVYDVSTATAMEYKTEYDESFLTVCSTGNYAYGGRTDTFYVVDIGGLPSSVSLSGSVSGLSGDYMRGVAINGNYAYVAHEGTLDIIDISTPSSPSLETTVSMYSSANAVEIGTFSGTDYAFIADGDGLTVVDVDTPASPSIVARFTGAPVSQDITVDGDYVLCTGGSGVSVIDVSAPSSPEYVGAFRSLDSDGDPCALTGLARDGNYCYITRNLDGFQVAEIDLTSPYSNFAVDYDTTTAGKFRVEDSTNTFILYWGHDNTTIDPALFGFTFSQESSGSGPYTMDSLYKPDTPVCKGNKKYISTANSVLDEDGNEVYLADGSTSIETNEEDAWRGVWHNGRYYGCNGSANYIIRDSHIRILPPNDECDISVVEQNDTSNHNIYSYNDDEAADRLLSVNADNPVLRIKLDEHTANAVANYMYFKCGSGDYPSYDSVYNFYIEIPAHDYKELFLTLTYQDIGREYPGSGSSWYYDVDGFRAFVPYTSSADVYILVERKGGPSAIGSLIFFYDDDGGVTHNIWQYDDSADLFGAVSGRLHMTFAATNDLENTKKYKYKIALVNAEGYVTQLQSVGNNHLTCSDDENHDISFGIPDRDNYDYKWIRMYRTEGDGSVYYKLIDMPAYMDYSSINSVICGCPDTDLGEEADDTTSRTTEMVYDRLAWWENRMFVAGISDTPDVVYWSVANEPENFNKSTQWVKVGRDGLPITGLAPLADRLIIFKENSIYALFPSGNSYRLEDKNDEGIGTRSQDSLVPDFGAKGAICYFQGQDGHFYATDGIYLMPLSIGRLDSFVNGQDDEVDLWLNKDYITETSGKFNNKDREVMWSVCTGTGSNAGSTTVNKNVIYDVDEQKFSYDDFPSIRWYKDRITSVASDDSRLTGDEKLLGHSSDGTIFFYGETADDMDSDIVATYETADVGYGQDEEIKSFISIEVSAYKLSESTQTLTVSWYTDGSDTADGSQDITLSDSPTKHNIRPYCRGKTLRIKIENDDSLGRVRINQIIVEYRQHNSRWRAT